MVALSQKTNRKQKHENPCPSKGRKCWKNILIAKRDVCLKLPTEKLQFEKGVEKFVER